MACFTVWAWVLRLGGFRALWVWWVSWLGVILVGFDFWLVGHGLPGSWLVSAWVGCGVGFWLWLALRVVLGVGLLVC